MERMKRWLSLALALVLVLSYVPANVFAADAGEESAPQETTASAETTVETTVSAEPEETVVMQSAQISVELPSNEELYTFYAEGVLYGMGGVSMFATGDRSAGAKLTGDEKLVYDALIPFIKDIAAGNRASTVVRLGYTSSYDSDKYVSFTGTSADFDLGAVMDALLMDYPYEMYWLNTLSSARMNSITTYPEDILKWMEISMPVAVTFASGDYTADTAKTGAVTSAATKAAAIVAKYASASDYDKLVGYRNEICALVSYDDTAASGGDSYYKNTDSNPWQLIYVFDGNTATNVVCEGYSKAFQYLCDLGGVPCICVRGTMTEPNGVGGHMWNVVTLEGKNYLVDVANSDEDTLGQNGELFLAGASGSPTTGYSFTAGGKTVSYAYGYDTPQIWTTEELTLASKSYNNTDVTACFVPNTNWKEANAWFAAYYWDGNGSDGFVKLEADGFCYTGEIPEGYNNIIFIRKNPSDTTLSWNNVWAQTGDLTLDASKSCFVQNAGWVNTGTWTTCPPAYDYYLAGYLNNANVGIEGAANASANKFANGKVTVTFTADSYACLGVQYGTSVIGNYMAQSYVSSGSTAAMYTTGGEKLLVPAGKYTFTLVENADGSVTLSYAHAHTMTYHAEVDATCAASGNVAYYACSVCGDNFSDEAGTTVLSDEDLIIPSGAHNYDDNGFCATETDGSVCDAYEPAVMVTADNCAGLGLAESYVGYYAIGNAGQLYWFADKVDNESADFITAKAVLTDNITVNEGTVTAASTGLREWNPIGHHNSSTDNAVFNGVFDGNGKTVSGLYFNDTNATYVGLIAYALYQAEVKNVTLSNSYLYGMERVGGIVGHNRGKVTDCVNNAQIGGSQNRIGGVVGFNEGIMAQCGNTGSIFSTSGQYVCGIAGGQGHIVNGSMNDCWNTGSVTGDFYVGGVAGSVNTNQPGTVIQIKNCWSVGSITCTDSETMGGIAGESVACQITSCYSTIDPIGTEGDSSTLTDVTVKTLEQFASGEVAYLLQGEQADQIWGQNIDNGQTVQAVPALYGAKVYQISGDCMGNPGYSNIDAAKAVHSYDENGFCTNKADYVVCDAYQPAVKVTEDNYTELGLTDAYIGYYAIQNAGNLYWFADKVDNENAAYRYANAVLTADFRIPSKSAGTRYWNPIGSADAKYSGIFDGNGKAIADIFAGDTTADMVGLVAWLTEDGVVKNVTVTGVRLNGNDTVGAIVAYNEGTVELCGNTASVIGEGISIGGIVGVNAGTVRNCWNTGRISGEDAGGIVGNNEPGATVANCWYTGELEGTNAGGIVGFHQTGATAESCYTTQETAIATAEGTVSKAETKTADQFASGEVAYLLGGVWGQNIDNDQPAQTVPALNGAAVYLVTADCQGNPGYSNTESTGTPAHNYVNGFCVNEANGVVCDAYEPAALVTEENYTELGLSADYIGYYAITNAGNLYWFAEKVDNENAAYKTAKVVLTADITVNTGTMDANTTGAREWNPIGYWGNSRDYAAFNGTFDGNNKKISGLYVNNTDNTAGKNVALIAETESGALVKNVTVTNTWFHGYAQVAGIVGDNGGTITGCVSEASLSCTWSYIGGMAGWNEGTITGCINRGTIAGKFNNSGGIAGHNAGTVELCGNKGNISDDWCFAGGIAGNNADTIRNCWNTGKVHVTNSIAGGIAGKNNPDDLLENCWSTGAVSCGSQPEAAGGIVGVSENATQRNCYSVMEPVGVIEDDGGVSTVENMDQITLDQLASGEVAYLLRTRAAAGTDVWGQNIDNGQPVQTVPALNGADVYYGYIDCHSTEAKYTNTAVSAEPVEHSYDNGFCTNELTDGTICDAYEPAVLVTAENREELGLTADYVGYYAISNAGQLYWFADKVDNENATYGSVNVVLTADVTVNEGTVTASSTGMRDWNPIGWFASTTDDRAAFSGTFDGNGKSISGLYFNNKDIYGVSLFAITGETALVKNVTVTNSYFCGNYNNSAVVAINLGTVSSCFNEATLKGDGQIGGIVGRNLGLVELCGNTGAITGDTRNVGGIVGENKNTVRNCWNTGNIQVRYYYAGGITGANNSVATDGTAALTENCWSTGTVVNLTYSSAGGIVGAAWVNLGGVRNCYSLMKPVGLNRNHPVTNTEQKTLDQFASGEVAYLLRTRAAEGTDVWGQNIDNDQTRQNVPALNGADVYQVVVDCAGGLGYSNTDASKAVHNYVNGFCVNENAEGGLCDAYEPAVPVTEENYTELGLTADYVGYYAISNAGQLYWFADKVDNEHNTYGSVNVVLTDNITVNAGTVTAESTGMRAWNPIGHYNSNDDNATFSGTFDGNGKTVSGLYYNDNGNDNSRYVALISCMAESGVVKNVTVTNSAFVGYAFTAAIVGYNFGTVTGCVNNAPISGSTYSGGIAANNRGTVELCGNTGTIHAWGVSGGIVARSISSGQAHAAVVKNCWNTGSISSEDNTAGGIAGESSALVSTYAFAEVRDCWSIGSVSAPEAAGGVTGKNWHAVVSNCYSVMAPVGTLEQDAYTRKTEQKTLEQFASGEVAYLLRTRATGGTNVWGQDLDNGKEVQTVPTFTGADVYYGYSSCAETEAKYTNDSNISADPIEHDWEYTADGASITGECKNECGTDGGKVTLVFNGSHYYDGTMKTVDVEGTLSGIETLPSVEYRGDRILVGYFTAHLTLEDGTKAQLAVPIYPREITPTIEGVEESYSYTGSAIEPTVTVKDGDKVLTEGKDYDVTYGENLNVGEGTVKVTLKGNYEGEAEQTFDIDPKAITPTVEGADDSYTYTGSAIQPTVTVKDGDKVLTEGTDYDVTYGENLNVGEGTVKVTLKGNYEGELEQTFDITAKAITPTVEGVEESYGYTGSAIEPTVTVKGDGKTLVEGTDYEVTYGDNTNVADGGSVKVTLKGNYQGEAEQTFTITARTLTISGMTGTDKVYDGTTDANVELTVEGIEETDDVEVSFQAAYESANAGTQRIHVTGITLSGDDASNYVIANETTGSGAIAQATVTVTSVTVADKTYDGTTDAEVTEVLSSGIVSGEDVTVTAAGSFDSAGSGENKTVALTYALSGEGSGNYVLAETTGATTASIKPVDAEEVMKPLEDVTTDNVTSDDLPAIGETRKELEDALEDPGLTDEQKKEIEDALDELDELEQRVDDAQNAVIDESVNDTMDVTGENVTKDDREDLEKAKDVLEDALDNFGDNYTDEEKEIIQENIDRIEDALDVLDKVEAVEDMIEALPDFVQPDDEETVAAIEEAKKAYDELTDHEKELVSDEAVEKLEGLLTALTYEIIKGNGTTWAKGTGARPEFTANGPYGKFAGLLVDGKEVAESNYEAKSGSTVITLKTAYIEGLTLGKHTITVLYTNGQADGYFYITVMSDAPATGDTANVALWSGIALISLAAAAALILGKKRLSV